MAEWRLSHLGRRGAVHYEPFFHSGDQWLSRLYHFLSPPINRLSLRRGGGFLSPYGTAPSTSLFPTFSRWATNGRLYCRIFLPPLSRLCRQLPSMGASISPLLEERWHAVSEWWLFHSIRDVEAPSTTNRFSFGRPMVVTTISFSFATP